MSADDTAANAAARAEAFEGEADVGLRLTAQAVADLWCIRAAALSPGAAGDVARAKLRNVCRKVADICAEYRVFGSGEAPGWDSGVEEAAKLSAARAEMARLTMNLDVARAALDFALIMAERGDIDEKWAAECRRMMREAREGLDD